MALINKGIIDNVEAAYIETYLRKNGLIPTEDEKGIQLADWINTLIKTNIIEKRSKVVQTIKQTICNPEAKYNTAVESWCHNDSKNVRRIGG